MSVVPEYHGPFGKQQAERLLWRAGFGARAGEAEALTKLGVASQRLMLNQNEMFRANALGSFKDILFNVTQDPAMLVWLNGNQNVKGKPNENYGREMLELFTLGANRGAYTETDVREQ